MPLFTTTLTRWHEGANQLRRGRYGVIETRAGQFYAVHLRRWPKLIAWPEVWPTGDDYHGSGEADRCLLYYNQPLRHPNFLALKYVVSTPGTTYATFRNSLVWLDALAALKQSDALLCDAANSRISDRLMERLGWEPHCPSRWHRNYIKRFYGVYPSHAFAGGEQFGPCETEPPVAETLEACVAEA